MLLTHNADVNAKDADGRSTLYILALENRLAMARFLLEHARADVESRDSEVCKNLLVFLVTYFIYFTSTFVNLMQLFRVELRCM